MDRCLGVGDLDRLHAYALELVNLTPDVIVTRSNVDFGDKLFASRMSIVAPVSNDPRVSVGRKISPCS
jgi:hypothetical protein